MIYNVTLFTTDRIPTRFYVLERQVCMVDCLRKKLWL